MPHARICASKTASAQGHSSTSQLTGEIWPHQIAGRWLLAKGGQMWLAVIQDAAFQAGCRLGALRYSAPISRRRIRAAGAPAGRLDVRCLRLH